MLIVAGILFVVIALIGLIILFEGGEPAGIFVALIFGCLSVNSFSTQGELDTLRAEAQQVEVVQAELADTKAANVLLTKAVAIKKDTVIKQRAQLEAAKGNIEGYKAQVADLTIAVSDAKLANQFLSDDLSTCTMNKSELEGDLEIVTGKLEKVRSYFKGGIN